MKSILEIFFPVVLIRLLYNIFHKHQTNTRMEININQLQSGPYDLLIVFWNLFYQFNEETEILFYYIKLKRESGWKMKHNLCPFFSHHILISFVLSILNQAIYNKSGQWPFSFSFLNLIRELLTRWLDF